MLVPILYSIYLHLFDEYFAKVVNLYQISIEKGVNFTKWQ